MIQPRGGDPIGPPAVHRRGWRFDEIGKSGKPTEILYDPVAELLHDGEHAIIATVRQEGSCDIRYCALEPSCLDGNMDVEQLRSLMAEHGETQAGIARLLGITPDKVSKMMAGKRSLRLSEANILRAYFGLNETKEAPLLLPIVGLVSAGSWQEGFPSVRGYMPSPDPKLSRESFVVIVEGDSMDLIAQDGEGIIVDPRQTELCDGGFYIVRNEEGEMTFKQYREAPARFEPCSTNPEHQTIYPGRELFTVVGRARKRVSDL